MLAVILTVCAVGSAADMHASPTGHDANAVCGFSAGSPNAGAEQFYGDEPMTLARWPNSGFRGAKSKEDDLTVIVDTDRVSRWAAETDPWIFACWQRVGRAAAVTVRVPSIL